jgi:hypothetical protein
MNDSKSRSLDDIMNQLIHDDVIDPCYSDWGCNPVLVPKKKNNKNASPNYRLCVDYRPVYSNTILNSYIKPRTDYILAQLGKAKNFTVTDLTKGYHQMLVKPEDRHKTAFVTPNRASYHNKR